MRANICRCPLFGLAELDKVLEGRGLDERFTSGKNASVTSVHFTDSSATEYQGEPTCQ